MKEAYAMLVVWCLLVVLMAGCAGPPLHPQSPPRVPLETLQDPDIKITARYVVNQYARGQTLHYDEMHYRGHVLLVTYGSSYDSGVTVTDLGPVPFQNPPR